MFVQQKIILLYQVDFEISEQQNKTLDFLSKVLANYTRNQVECLPKCMFTSLLLLKTFK